MTNEETKDRILIAADALFGKSGIRTTTIDDVCRAVGISKKTFYQFYAQKENLVASVAQFHFDRKMELLEGVIEGNDSVEILKGWLEYIDKKKFFESDKRLGDEFQKYYPDAFKEGARKKSKAVKNILERYLEKGIADGYIRDDIDVDAMIILLSMMHKGVMMYSGGDLVFGVGRKVSNKRLMTGFKYVLVRTLLSAKGLEYYESIGREDAPPVV